MFSSFVSLLPSALHIHNNQDLPRPTISPDETVTEDEDERDTRSAPPLPQSADEQVRKGKEKESKSPNETFIIVRPPPSKSNHPLNLQVQLVPPNAKPPSGVVPTDGNPTTPTSADSNRSSTDGVSLTRTTSSRSVVSYDQSAYGSSTASFSSVTSTATSNARRTIIPLYNLQAHNVMTNVIVDAGTDAKIAKFQKRGLELIDLALLEPVEVWGNRDASKEARRESLRISVDEMGAMVTNPGSSWAGLLSAKSIGGFLQPGNGSRPVTPSAASSSTSLHSHSNTNLNAKGPSNLANNAGIQAPVPQTRDLANRRSSQFIPGSSKRENFLGSTKTTPVPPPSPSPLVSPPIKRNIFNKLFNKRNSTPPSPIVPSITPTPKGHEPEDPQPYFAAFSMTPSPVGSDPAENVDSRGRHVPPPLMMEPSPISPASPAQMTPTQRQPGTPGPSFEASEEGLVSPTPTVAPRKEERKGHGRNLSLTNAITNPLKLTLRNNRNRLSAAVNGGLSSPGLGMSMGGEGERRDRLDRVSTTKRDASPNPSLVSRNQRSSRLSLVPTSTIESTDDRLQPPRNGQSNGNGQPQYAPVMLTQSQANLEITNLKQQQLQLRPPVLDIQPTFVSSNPQTNSNTMPLVAALGPRVAEDPGQVLQGQRALMYVWLVRRWLKRRPSALAGLGDAAAGFFGSVINKTTAGGNGNITSPGGEKQNGNGLGMMQAIMPASTAGSRKDHKDKEKGEHVGHGHAPAVGIHHPHHHQQEGTQLAYGGVEVRFEWKRARGKDAAKKGKKVRKGRRSSASRADAAGGSDGEVEKASMRDRTAEREEAGPAQRIKAEEKRKNRMSTGSLSTTNGSDEGFLGESPARRRLQRTSTRGDDDGDESDPEDSETPWVCTLKLRRCAAAAAAAAGAEDFLSPVAGGYDGRNQAVLQPSPQVLRIKVGTLSPTPHHPKVVAMLKVPYPLPDVEVEHMSAVKRKLGQENQPARDGKEPYHGLVMTAEEIKDVVCSTGLWLVVREGFGGVGRVSRKGDGWRIRA